MKAPDPERSCKISEEFDNLASSSSLSPGNMERLKNVGELLFSEDDIYATADQLSQIFRKLCVENQVTEAYFNEKYRQYAINVLGKLPQSASNNRANTVKMLKKGNRLTWKKFLEYTTLVLGLKLTNMRIDFINLINDKVQTFEIDNTALTDEVAMNDTVLENAVAD